MANLTETSVYESGIYQIEMTDPIQGGPDGISNLQAKQLGNRTRFLKDRFETGHNPDGTHITSELQTALTGALANQQLSSTAGLAEDKLNLIFRGATRPGDQGIYHNTRELADDILWLSSMNSLGDLLLNKTTLEIARDLCYQFYPSSGVLYAGATGLSGYTAVMDGEVGGGIFTKDTAHVTMSDKIKLAGIIQFLIDGYTIPIRTPVDITLPDAGDAYDSGVLRTDLVYVVIHHENITDSNQFYDKADLSGTQIDWSGLSETEQKEAAVQVENNLYMGADYNVYQIQYQILTAAGAGSLTDLGYSVSVDDSYMYELGDTRAIELCTVDRRNKGAYHSVFNVNGTAAFYGDTTVLEENEVTHSGPSYDILSVSTASNHFVIAGDHAADFADGSRFNVTGAISGTDDNSRDYEVDTAVYADPNTTITVTRDITADTGANGQIHKGWPAAPFYDIQATNTSEQQFSLTGDKTEEFPVGYAIEVIGTSTNDADYTVTAVEFDGTDTWITVDGSIDNTGNTGKLHSVVWFHINYCFNRRSIGAGAEISGSIASGVVAASSDSDFTEYESAHDHIADADITEGRTFLDVAERATDPNLTLSEPIIEGMPASVYELQVVEGVISPYSAAYTYTISAVNVATGASVGTIEQSDANITWTLPEVSADISVRFSISAEDASGHISPVKQYSVSVLNIGIESDDAFITDDTDWEDLTDATASSDGVTATSDNATAYTVPVYQTSEEADWAKYQIEFGRDLYEWTVDGSSTTSSLVLVGDHSVSAGKLYAVKFAGGTTVFVSDLDVTSTEWDAETTTNTLTLGSSLSPVPERVWSWDVSVEYAVGTEDEALVHEEALSVDVGTTTTTQVVGTSLISDLWVNGGYHNTALVTVDGVEKTVNVLGVSETSGVYTLQIPEQTHAPTTLKKPSCFTECTNPESIEYDSSLGIVTAEYPEQVVYDSNIRQVRLYTEIAQSGVVLKPVTVELWKQI
jgi:hypothetical protein